MCLFGVVAMVAQWSPHPQLLDVVWCSAVVVVAVAVVVVVVLAVVVVVK